MDDLTLRYFDAEMRYLREAGAEFARAHPDRAALLNPDRAGACDPYVERLFEGFAFLMGRLREKLDDDLPELTEGLVSLLWPHYLRTIPSMAMVEFTPQWRGMKERLVMARGSEVLSRPLGEKRTRCRYTTTRDLNLLPLELAQAALATAPDGRSVIRLRFACSELADWRCIDMARLPLYLNADAPLACALHEALTLNVAQLWLRLPGVTDRIALDGHFAACGFGDDDNLWPKGEGGFSGWQLLLEYFTFREKFMSVALCGLEKVRLPEGMSGFEIEAVLEKRWQHDFSFTAEHIRPHCVPVINLFPLESDPITLDGLQTEYLLRPMRIQDGHTEIYTVDSVQAAGPAGVHSYVPFTTFRHKGGMLRHDAPEYYWHTRVRRGPSGLHDTWLILGGGAFEGDRVAQGESLSLTLTGTNGQLPRRALQSTVLDTVVKSTAASVRVRNLTAPTLPCYPPNRDRFHWRVLSHLGSSFLWMMDNPEVLRGTLALYDWTDDEMNRRRLAAITDVRHSEIERFERGHLLRGVRIEVTLDSAGFAGSGDIALFGEMLSRFFALYTDIHLFNQLVLILQPTGERLEWEEKHRRIPG
ncbi:MULTISPECIES: type VI secretion system baseplate subunit TssF [Tenebrionibacter/Tenebrionicola group]|jgi:type VI secretion system protein ImpG|uniref:Type VI secretion system baseplate subunit TssF n=2 Tax=Tenebrionibacter/Tenebrionicola group TaxID=2969848 RepID=A0A8K0V041_9ENTR|nr:MULTISPECIES: type VI secretion system baseplate subunit TssF [Tenebrionibacter/Tenebrionicola group]MBK4714187.1 type VI secretion system baseplate subunit TssF [Tenebrionibacter intestinalis]MBV4413282.1 type VI secretion system baseplate subunit TssF [Tenebrionicola larvae]MBV5094224.1 type VI secretion system baseplate subunit TssF [Tenebrionicola larvae]